MNIMDFVNKILTSRENIQGEIYVIRNKINNKQYIGQTLSHRKNHDKYRPFGSECRFKEHISEALNNTKGNNGCVYLNNAIRLYGRENFEYKLVLICNLNDLDHNEIEQIKEYDTFYPTGYNLTTGGRTTKWVKHNITNNQEIQPVKKNIGFKKSEKTKEKMSISLKEALSSEESRKKISNRTFLQHEKARKQKLQKFIENGNLIPYEDDVNEYIRTQYKNSLPNRYLIFVNQVFISSFNVGKSKAEDVYQKAVDFAEQLKEGKKWEDDSIKPYEANIGKITFKKKVKLIDEMGNPQPNF